jgi:hypothetical protein
MEQKLDVFASMTCKELKINVDDFKHMFRSDLGYLQHCMQYQLRKLKQERRRSSSNP